MSTPPGAFHGYFRPAAKPPQRFGGDQGKTTGD